MWLETGILALDGTGPISTIYSQSGQALSRPPGRLDPDTLARVPE
jgi:hypothetical protein